MLDTTKRMVCRDMSLYVSISTRHVKQTSHSPLRELEAEQHYR
jgi:hypothetical protein